jgi:hypothetical protein
LRLRLDFLRAADVSANDGTEQEPHRDPWRAAEDSQEPSGRSALTRALLRNPIPLVDIEVMTSERAAQQEPPIVVAFDKPDVPRPLSLGELAAGPTRAVSRGRVSLDCRPLSIERDHRQIETHAANLTPRPAGVTPTHGEVLMDVSSH